MRRPSDPTDAIARAARGELLGPMDMRAIWQCGRSQYYAREKRGDFDRFKVKDPIGSWQFSGAKVHRYLQGERVDEPFFGRKIRRVG
jgi:hypothetical protein